MTRRSKGAAVLVSMLVVSLGAFAMTSTAAKRVKHIGAETEQSTSKQVNKRTLVVTGEVISGVPRCERQRSVLLYEAGPTGNLAGGAIGHGVTQGGTSRGEFTIQGRTVKKITPTRRFILETVARRVKIKGQLKICKRSVSQSFLATYP